MPRKRNDPPDEGALLARFEAAARAAVPGPWRFPIAEEAVRLFEALPEAFTFEEMVEAADALGIAPEAAVAHLRAYQGFEMISTEGDVFLKTGDKPYF